MGVDATVFTSVKKQSRAHQAGHLKKVQLLFVGRLTEKKGVRYLVDAMPMVLKECPEVHLLIIGDGEQRAELEKQVAALGLLDSVHFAGGLPNGDLPAYYAAADVFIAPSITAKGGDSEGFGLTLVEASMSGCLVISTKTGGIEDIVQDGKSGFLVPQKDSRALAEKLLYVLAHKKETEMIRENGRTRCLERYDWDVICKRYETVFTRHIFPDTVTS